MCQLFPDHQLLFRLFQLPVHPLHLLSIVHLQNLLNQHVHPPFHH